MIWRKNGPLCSCIQLYYHSTISFLSSMIPSTNRPEALAWLVAVAPAPAVALLLLGLGGGVGVNDIKRPISDVYVNHPPKHYFWKINLSTLT